MQNSIQSQVMSIAHEIKSFFSTFGQALKAAWKIVKLHLGIETIFAFENKEGDRREADIVSLGSLKTIEKGFIRFTEMGLDGIQWRSFRINRLLQD